MIALTRADVDDLNRRAIAHLETAGHLDAGRDRLDVGERTYGIGEQVMALRNDRRAGLVNGTTGTVTGIDHDDRSLTVRPDQPDTPDITVAAHYLADGHLTHGWAITAHKAQGITTGQAFVLGTDRLYREARQSAAVLGAATPPRGVRVPGGTPFGRSGIDSEGRLTVRFVPGVSSHPRAWDDDIPPVIGQTLAQLHRATDTFRATASPWVRVFS